MMSQIQANQNEFPSEGHGLPLSATHIVHMAQLNDMAQPAATVMQARKRIDGKALSVRETQGTLKTLRAAQEGAHGRQSL